jgi:hypothetical protein
MATTNPAHSAFTVAIDFKGTFYDVEITPTLNGQPIEWIQDRVDQWTSAERTNQLFSRKIVEMLNHTNMPADYSLATHGVITAGSVQGFTFDKGLEITHTTQDVWEEFIDCLRDPVSQTAGLAPVNEDVAETGLAANFKLTTNVYSNLRAEDQKDVRLSLFQKKCYNYYGTKHGVELPHEISEYTAPEKACLEHLLYRNPLKEKLRPAREAVAIMVLQSEEERREMASEVKRIRAGMENAALKPRNSAEDSASAVSLDELEEEITLRQQNKNLPKLVLSDEEDDIDSDVEELVESSDEEMERAALSQRNVVRTDSDSALEQSILSEQDYFYYSDVEVTV